MTVLDQAIAYANDHREPFLNHLFEILKFPSVSTRPEAKEDVLKCAKFITSYLSSLPMDQVSCIETPGHPIVFGTLGNDPAKPTILVYGHYDVQPEDPVHEWNHPPFSPKIVDDYIIARGASDDKGQVACYLYAIESWLATGKDLPVNIKLLIEGEEEIGSPNLSPFLKSNADALSADICLVSDTPMFQETQPSICVSLRGLLCTELTIHGPADDCHSGQHGGIFTNPIHALSHIISQLIDPTGRCLVPGFYDDVLPLNVDERQALSDLTWPINAYQSELGIPQFSCENDEILAHKWYYPTFDCNGIYGGFQGDGSKTIIPRSATAKLSMRLVANQAPEKIYQQLSDYITSIIPEGVTANLTPIQGMAHPIRITPDHDAFPAAQAALKDTFHQDPVFVGEGGSIPVINDIQNILGIPTVLMGFNGPNDRIHAPNERFAISQFYQGIETILRFFSYYGRS